VEISHLQIGNISNVVEKHGAMTGDTRALGGNEACDIHVEECKFSWNA